MTKKTRNTLLISAGAIIILILVSPRLKLFTSESGRPGGPNVGAPLPVTAHIASPQALDTRIRATGSIIANEEVDLKTETAGKIIGIYFKEGTRVRKGELLAKINDAELQASLIRAESQEKLAADKEQRRRVLFEKNNISPEDYEVTLNELKSLQAEVKLIKARIAKAEVRAPFDGYVGLRYVSEGSYVSTDTRIATLQDVNQVKLDFSIPERYANDVRRGQSVLFRVTGNDRAYSGRIYAIEPKIDLNTRTVQLRAICPNPEGRIIPGSFAEVELVLGETPDALLVPTEALIPELGGQKLYVVRDGKAVPLMVETGIRTDRNVQITKGLAINDTVITSGTLQIRPGMPVQITSLNSQ